MPDILCRMASLRPIVATLLVILFSTVGRAQESAISMLPVQATNRAIARTNFAPAAPVTTETTPTREPGQHFQSDADRDQQRILLLSLMGALITVAIAYSYLRKNRAPSVTK